MVYPPCWKEKQKWMTMSRISELNKGVMSKLPNQTAGYGKKALGGWLCYLPTCRLRRWRRNIHLPLTGFPNYVKKRQVNDPCPYTPRVEQITLHNSFFICPLLTFLPLHKLTHWDGKNIRNGKIFWGTITDTLTQPYHLSA